MLRPRRDQAAARPGNGLWRLEKHHHGRNVGSASQSLAQKLPTVSLLLGLVRFRLLLFFLRGRIAHLKDLSANVEVASQRDNVSSSDRKAT